LNDFLDHLARQILEILRHHDLEQLRFGGLGFLRQTVLERKYASPRPGA
jgi:hypothetical protein